MNKYGKAFESILGLDVTEAMNVYDWVENYGDCSDIDLIDELLDKEDPKKPNLEGDGYYDGELVYDTWICPSCEKRYEVDYDRYDYCPNCGQKIDWRDEDE